ncbi:potassium/proton antiporter [Thiohalophilus sp.]|uniref:potassium/proton antiporter n=1 Tax=Thiohalophilus sp. TaxID=3028392 RepID=UPI003974752F
MDLLNNLLLIAALLLFGSIVVSSISARVGAPLLLIFLIVGMLGGEEGPGNLVFDDVGTAYLIGSTALGIILLNGGLHTKFESFRVGLRPALSLATVGVLITSGLVGLAAAWIFELHWMQGMLLGAIIGSTDAAAVFSLLHARGMNIERRVGATLEIESGSNDPMAIFLTIVLIELIQTQQSLMSWDVLLSFCMQMGIGALAGVLGARLLGFMINHLTLANGLYPLLVTSGGLLVFALSNSLGGSGFLAIYLVGVVLGNRKLHAGQNILRVHDGLAWLSQIGMFLILGLLVTPSELYPVAWHALLIALVLIFIARPLAVLLCLLPFRFAWREMSYIAWVGLRGAVPIILALFPLLAGMEQAELYFNVAFFVVLVSLLLQGWTVAPVARWLRLEIPPGPEPVMQIDTLIPGHPECEILVYHLGHNSPLRDRSPDYFILPGTARLTSVIRDGISYDAKDIDRFAEGDYVHILAASDEVDQINRLFTTLEYAADHQFFGDFILDPAAKLCDLSTVYGVSVPERCDTMTVGEYVAQQFRNKPVVGDRARLDTVELVVLEIEQGRIVKVGLKIA